MLSTLKGSSVAHILLMSQSLYDILHSLPFETRLPHLVTSFQEGKCGLRDVIHSPLPPLHSAHLPEQAGIGFAPSEIKKLEAHYVPFGLHIYIRYRCGSRPCLFKRHTFRQPPRPHLLSRLAGTGL